MKKIAMIILIVMSIVFVKYPSITLASEAVDSKVEGKLIEQDRVSEIEKDSTHADKDHKDKATETLPKTGANNNFILVFIGILLVGIIGMKFFNLYLYKRSCNKNETL